MKIAGYYKSKGVKVELLTTYEDLDKYDKVFIAKVFTDTLIDDGVLSLPNVVYGGTGFFYDKAPSLPYDIEHHMPDYHLYDDWVNKQSSKGIKPRELKYYTDFSIGYLTRGCFRHCSFCVNQNKNGSFAHSPLNEFFDKNRKYICLLDDNFLACGQWKTLLFELQSTKKPFEFNQGLDERLLTEEKIKLLFNSRLFEDVIFAFDNIKDKDIIESKLQLIKEICPNNKKRIKFYVLCGYDRDNKYDLAFWKQDIADVFERIKILMKYNCTPYIMRYNKYNESKYRGMYIYIACWVNQVHLFKKCHLENMSLLKTNNIKRQVLHF